MIRFLAVALPLAAVPTYVLSCGDPSHVYQGRLFRENRGCVEGTTSLDVVEGEPPGQCGPICLAQPLSDGGRTIYVATACAPFPFGFDAGGNDPTCAPALAALARKDTCLSDGGSASPLPPAPPDAGQQPADAGTD